MSTSQIIGSFDSNDQVHNLDLIIHSIGNSLQSARSVDPEALIMPDMTQEQIRQQIDILYDAVMPLCRHMSLLISFLNQIMHPTEDKYYNETSNPRIMLRGALLNVIEFLQYFVKNRVELHHDLEFLFESTHRPLDDATKLRLYRGRAEQDYTNYQNLIVSGIYLRNVLTTQQPRLVTYICRMTEEIKDIDKDRCHMHI